MENRQYQWECQFCGKKIKSNKNLKRHENTHVKPFKCVTCGSAFSRNEHLQIHEYLHTGETPFPCSKCGKGFRSVKYQREHERKVHKYWRGKQDNQKQPRSTPELASVVPKAIPGPSRAPPAPIPKMASRPAQTRASEPVASTSTSASSSTAVCFGAGRASKPAFLSQPDAKGEMSSGPARGRATAKRVTLPLHEFPIFNSAPILKKKGFQQCLGNKKETVTLISTSTSPNLNTRGLPKKHVEKVITVVLYRCQFCSKDFCNPSFLGRHMNMAHGIVPPTQTVMEIRRPQSATGVQDGGVQKGSTLPVRRQQEKEVRDGYQGEEPCFICGLVFSTASQLMMHEKVHAATGESASFNEPVPIQPDDEDDDPVNDEEFRNNVINLVGIENVDDDEEEEEDVGHIEDVQVQPMEMDSNDFEIPHSEYPLSEQEHCVNVKKHPPRLEDEKSQTQTINTLRASRAHLHGHGPGRSEKAESLPLKSEPEASAKAVVLASGASGTRPEFEQKMRLKNNDSTVKVTPPTLLCQDEEICIIKGHDEGQGKRDSRLRQNPKRKRFDEYENHLTPNPRETNFVRRNKLVLKK